MAGFPRNFPRHIAGAVFLAFALALAAPAKAAPKPDRLEILALLRANDFSRLEKKFGGYHRAYDAGEVPEIVVELAYYAFAAADPDLEDRFAQWIADRPESHAARLARGFYYWHLGWVTRGLGYWNEIEKPNKPLLRRYFKLARRDIDRALEMNPRIGLAYAMLINSIMVSGVRPKRDMASIRREGSRADPRSTLIDRFSLMAMVPWWSRYRGDEGVKQYLRQIEPKISAAPQLRPLLGYPDFVHARTHSRLGRHDKATVAFQRALRFGDYALYWHWDGVNHYRAGRYKEAVESFTRALTIRPQEPGYLDRRAMAYRRLGDYEKAFADWKLALTIDPMNPRTLLRRAYALEDLKRYREALSEVQKATLYGAGHANVWEAMGWLYLAKLNQPQKAAPPYKRALDLNPRNSGNWYNYAISLYHANPHDCAAKEGFKGYLSACRRRGNDCSFKYTIPARFIANWTSCRREEAADQTSRPSESR